MSSHIRKVLRNDTFTKYYCENTMPYTIIYSDGIKAVHHQSYTNKTCTVNIYSWRGQHILNHTFTPFSEVKSLINQL